MRTFLRRHPKSTSPRTAPLVTREGKNAIIHDAAQPAEDIANGIARIAKLVTSFRSQGSPVIMLALADKPINPQKWAEINARLAEEAAANGLVIAIPPAATQPCVQAAYTVTEPRTKGVKQCAEDG